MISIHQEPPVIVHAKLNPTISAVGLSRQFPYFKAITMTAVVCSLRAPKKFAPAAGVRLERKHSSTSFDDIASSGERIRNPGTPMAIL